MNLRLAAIVGISLFSLASVGPALAASPMLGGDVTLLAGPGQSFGSVGQLAAKTKVGLLWCGPEKFDWCLVSYHKTGGWVHTADLLLLGPNGEIIPGGSFGLAKTLGGTPPTRRAIGLGDTGGSVDAGSVGASGSGAVGSGVSSGSGGPTAGSVGHGGLPGL